MTQADITAARTAVHLRALAELCTALADDIEDNPTDSSRARRALAQVHAATSARVVAKLRGALPPKCAEAFISAYRAVKSR